VDDESSSSDKSDSESESLSPNKRKRRDQEYEPTDEEGSPPESDDEMDEHEKEVLQEDTSPDSADMDEEEYALQQVTVIFPTQRIRISGLITCFHLAPCCFCSNRNKTSICFFQDNGCVYVASK
jgi:hypothetical protein